MHSVSRQFVHNANIIAARIANSHRRFVMSKSAYKSSRSATCSKLYPRAVDFLGAMRSPVGARLKAQRAGSDRTHMTDGHGHDCVTLREDVCEDRCPILSNVNLFIDYSIHHCRGCTPVRVLCSGGRRDCGDKMEMNSDCRPRIRYSMGDVLQMVDSNRDSAHANRFPVCPYPCYSSSFSSRRRHKVGRAKMCRGFRLG